MKGITLVPDGPYQETENAIAEVMLEQFELFKRKHASYGPGNISKFGELGCLVRASDKVERLIHILWHNKQNPLNDESIEDTWLDLANYCLIAILNRRGLWK